MDENEIVAQIKRILKVIEKTDILEIEWEKDDCKLHLKRNPQTMEFAPIFEKGEEKKIPLVSEGAKEKSSEKKYETITSPMVGTFYLKSPQGSFYVKVGDIVESGQKIGVIEAMRIMKEIFSPFAGEIKEILVKDGDPVEYGQPIFLIAPLAEPTPKEE